MRDDADTGGDGSQLAHRPVAQDADDLLVAQGASLDPLGEQAICGIVTGQMILGAARLENAANVAVELECNLGFRGVGTCQGRPVILAGPLAQGFMQVARPPHERTLDTQREILGKAVDQLDVTGLWQRGGQLAGDRTAERLERLHARGREVRLDQPAKQAVFWRVHSVGHRGITGYRAAEGFVVQQYLHDVGVAQQGPLQVVAVRHGTTCP